MNETHVRTLIREAALKGVTLWVADGRLHYKAKNGALTEDLRATLQAKKDGLVGELTQPSFRKIGSRAGTAVFPLCVKGFWEENEANPSLRYATHFAMSVTGTVLLSRIQSAFKRLTSRYDLLRSKVRIDDGIPHLDWDEHDCYVPLEIVDISRTPTANRSTQLQEAVQRAIYTPFEQGGIYRAQIIKASEREYAITIVIHHFVADAVSLGILLRELADSLRGAHQAEDEENRPLQYSDYLLAMNEWLSGPGVKYRVEYWKNKLRGVPSMHFPRASESKSDGPWELAVVEFPVSEALRTKLTHAVAISEVPFVVGLLAVNFAALANSLQSTDIVIAFVHSGRIAPALDELVGFTANCFPVRVSIDPQMSFVDLMRRVHETYTLAADYQIPLGVIMDSLGEIESSLVAPLFNYLPVYDYFPGAGPRTSAPASRPQGTSFEIRHIDVEGPTPTNSAEWKSHELNVIDHGAEMVVNVKYMPSKYQALAIHEFADTISQCMEALAEDPASCVWLARESVSSSTVY